MWWTGNQSGGCGIFGGQVIQSGGLSDGQVIQSGGCGKFVWWTGNPVWGLWDNCLVDS